MGCITKHYLDKDSILGVWKIEEDLCTLLKMVSLKTTDKERYKEFRSNSRRIEFLSVRALLMELIGPEASILYNKFNKPFLKDGSHFISISHSHKLTAILLSRSEKVGIDLEFMSSNISAFAFKFINRSEKITRDKELRKYHLYIHWCAKEALYKICDKPGISLRKDIIIKPFAIKEAGEIEGIVKSKIINDSFTLNYSTYDNYAIVWTKKNYENI